MMSFTIVPLNQNRDEEVAGLKKRISDLEKERDDLLSLLKGKQVTDERCFMLENDNKTLQERCLTLENDNKTLEKRCTSLEQEIEALKSEIRELRLELDKIAVREVMRALEHYVAIDILGSKRQVRKQGLTTLEQLKTSTYAPTLQKKMTEDQITLLTVLKDIGDDTVHNRKLPDSMEDLLRCLQDEEDDEDDKKNQHALALMLKNYCSRDGVPYGTDPLKKKQVVSVVSK